MTLDKLLTTFRKKAKDVDVSNTEFLAVQVNIEDADPGVFYFEVKDHKINIEPYDYHDRNCAITIKMADLEKLLKGNFDAVDAFYKGDLKVDGDIGKALEFSDLIRTHM